jgi:hypothetical protein
LQEFLQLPAGGFVVFNNENAPAHPGLFVSFRRFERLMSPIAEMLPYV